MNDQMIDMFKEISKTIDFKPDYIKFGDGGKKMNEMEQLRTLKDLRTDLITETFNHESICDKRKTFAYNLALDDLREEAKSLYDYYYAMNRLNTEDQHKYDKVLEFIMTFFNLTEEDVQ